MCFDQLLFVDDERLHNNIYQISCNWKTIM